MERESYERISQLFLADSLVPPCCNHQILLAFALVGHRSSIAARRQFPLPQQRAGAYIKGADACIGGSGDEDQTSGSGD